MDAAKAQILTSPYARGKRLNLKADVDGRAADNDETVEVVATAADGLCRAGAGTTKD